MRNVIFDLDGTLALCDHRRHYVERDDPDWDSFFAECDKDPVNEPVARLFRWYRNRPDHRVWVLSGRSGSVETESKTRHWLVRNDLVPDWKPELPRFEVLGRETICFYMRSHGDHRPDVEVKREMIDSLGLTPENTEVVFDDRNCMVKAWREWGFTCFQVAEGEF